MQMDKSVWILEDDPGAIFVYKDILSLRYKVEIFREINTFVTALREKSSVSASMPDLAITDLKVGDKSFLDFLTSDESLELLRCPFIVVSSVDDIDVLRLCFNEGATDYLTKPFTKNELLVKVERMMAAAQSMPLAVSEAGDKEVVFDPRTLSLRRGNAAAVQLTAKQLQIYSLLEAAKGNPVSKEALEKEIWGDVTVGNKSLDVHIFHLRQKLKDLNMKLLLIPNVGYLLKVN